ncbi:MAG: sortase [Bacilli bacterium]|nr:sortase [Bacilli bacterium]
MTNLSNRMVVIIAFAIIISGFILVSYDYFAGKKDKAYEKVSISLYQEQNGVVIDNTPQEIASADISVSEETKKGNYLGVLKIDKIDLEQGFYDKDNENNNVGKNVTLLEPSDYPDEKNGNTILVAHSGSSYLGYFKNLWKLSKGDLATIYYKNKTYIYRIVNIYNDTKDGDVTIYRNKNKNTLTMITCTKDSDTEQTIYVAELE